jgi:hypothetical protein
MFALIKTINSNNLNPAVALRLFNTYVALILMYNCEIWSPHFIKILMKDDQNSLLSSLEKFSFEKIQSKFCKWILGVNRYTSIQAYLGYICTTSLRKTHARWREVWFTPPIIDSVVVW